MHKLIDLSSYSIAFLNSFFKAKITANSKNANAELSDSYPYFASDIYHTYSIY